MLKCISDYISIPNQSPQFDADCYTNGLQEKAVECLVDWVSKQQVAGMTYKVISEPNRTPLIFINVPGTNETKETVLLYGHLDKQPPMTEGWNEGLGPFKPVIKENDYGTCLYGRGGADDGTHGFYTHCNGELRSQHAVMLTLHVLFFCFILRAHRLLRVRRTGCHPTAAVSGRPTLSLCDHDRGM